MTFASKQQKNIEREIERERESMWYLKFSYSRDTFLGVRSWLRDVRTLANPELVIILVGNKNDKADEREVSYLEASRFAQEHGKLRLRLKDETNSMKKEMMFLEASALSGDGVEDVFFKCARSILSKIETGQIDPERSGSGVQFGDSSFRRMTQRTRIRKKERSCCSFWVSVERNEPFFFYWI